MKFRQNQKRVVLAACAAMFVRCAPTAESIRPAIEPVPETASTPDGRISWDAIFANLRSEDKNALDDAFNAMSELSSRPTSPFADENALRKLHADRIQLVDLSVELLGSEDPEFRSKASAILLNVLRRAGNDWARSNARVHLDRITEAIGGDELVSVRLIESVSIILQFRGMEPAEFLSDPKADRAIWKIIALATAGDSPAIRESAIYAIADIRHPSISILSQIADCDSEPLVRIAAIHAIEALLGEKCLGLLAVMRSHEQDGNVLKEYDHLIWKWSH